MMDKIIGSIVKVTSQPIIDGIDVVDGLLEGEIRKKAACRLGEDVVAGMALSEMIESLQEME